MSTNSVLLKLLVLLNEVSMCPAPRTVNVKSICPASVNHVSYRVRSIRASSSSLHSGANQLSDVIPCYFMYDWINKL